MLFYNYAGACMDRLSPTSALVQGENLVYQQDGRQVMIALDTPDWQSWLENSTSFTFKSAEGNFTAHKTRASNGRGSWYWYAYRRQHGHLSNFYLGTSAKLTLQRLREAAGSLALPAAEDAAAIQPEPPLDIQDESLPNTNAVLISKLSIPRISRLHISRPRLLAFLDRGALQPLTVISAPAGSGKTTLLTEWAATTTHPVAWLSLEAADNDPLRFLSYLIAALQRLDERIGVIHQSVDTQNSEHALIGILNDLTRWLEQETILILDDYHVLTSETIQAQLLFLLDHLPARLHVIIGTRVDPALPLARLRARGQLSEIRAPELRFISDEVAALADAMGLALSGEATNLLEQRTEGWVAGIQLLALALRGQADTTAFLRAFRGTHHFLLAYVGEEVLALQTPAMQRFLLHTCILARMTGPLCEAVTDLPDGQARLAELLRANLFVSTLDDAEIWYRYHPLFAETLRAHLQKREPEIIPELYLRASLWYEQHQGAEEACNYALLAGDFPRAAQLIAELLPRMVEQGRFEQLGHWLGQLPPALIAASPQLYIATPWLSAFGRRSPENMDQVLKRMEQHVQKQQQNAPASWVEPQSVLTLFQALTAMAQNNLPRAFLLVRKALRALTTRETSLSQLISRFLQISLSVMYGASGDLATAEQILLDLSLMQPTEAFSLVNLAAPFLLGELYKAQGRLRKANALYEDLYQILSTHADIPPMPLLVMGFSLMRKSLLLYEWDRLPETARNMQQVLEIIPRAVLDVIPSTTQPELFAFGLWAQARIEWAQGHPEAARYFLELVRKQPEMMGELPPGKDRPPIDISMLAARLALACGQIEEAIHWENTCGIQFDDAPGTLLEGRQIFAYLTLARVLIARGRGQHDEAALSQALILLGHWRDLAQRLDFQGWLIEIQMLTALVLHAQGQTSQALTTLGTTLEQAEAEGYIRLFADEGQPMTHLLAQIAAYTTVSPSYLQRIQNAFLPTHQTLLAPATRTETAQTLLDPLSAREREVLSLLADGSSNQQIADRLVISPNTAKRHVKNILAKLDATNRTQAVARARELHLL